MSIYLDEKNPEKHKPFDDASPDIVAYVRYLEVIAGKSPNTAFSYYCDLRNFSRFMKRRRGLAAENAEIKDIDPKGLDTAALAAAGLTAETEHTQVKIGFTCPKETSDLNLFVNMTKLNGIQIDAMNLMTENGNQKVTMTLDGKITDAGMRCLLCQIGKEAEEFRILELISI